jgi:hypothetical protein
MRADGVEIVFGAIRASRAYSVGWNHPIDKNALKINNLEHVLIGKVSQLFRNML